jgi:hypothetical protein
VSFLLAESRCKNAAFRKGWIASEMNMTLEAVVENFADALVSIDTSRVPFRKFLSGVGPYGEPQLLSLVATRLNSLVHCEAPVCTKRTPDLLLPGEWAIECKIARPFGDNGKPAENWSVNLLHPYEGNTSLLGDCLKLRSLVLNERKAVIVIGYEHTPPQISLTPLLAGFEVVAREVLHIRLSERVQATRFGLVHPVHQQLSVTGWEVL